LKAAASASVDFPLKNTAVTKTPLHPITLRGPGLRVSRSLPGEAMADKNTENDNASPLLLPIIGIVVVAACAALFLFRGHADPAPAATTPSAGAAAKLLTIAVIPKGTTHEFWKSIHAGAVKAERELEGNGRDIVLIWKGPLKEDDRAQQIDVVQGFVAQKVAGIVLAPLDSKALARPVEDAAAAGIPVVIIDSGIESDKLASFVATNNFDGGQQGGRRLGEALGGKGKVVLLRYAVGSASTEQREAGFLDAIGKFPGIEIISKDQYAGATRDSAYTASQNLLNLLGTQCDGIFTPNESSTAGMILALKDASLSGKVKHVGFDTSAPLIEALKAGVVHGLVAQDPFQMGYLGVKHVIDAIDGRPVPKQVDTPVRLITPENINDQAIVDLVNPPLGKYLD
jgi:ribose transport system substrate-binding protein